jgi:hypothetical protein
MIGPVAEGVEPGSTHALAYLLAGFDAAVERSGETAVDVALAGYRVRLRFAGPSLVRSFTDAITHRRLPRSGTADLTVHIWDEASTGIPAPVPPGAAPLESVAGSARGDQVVVVFEPAAGAAIERLHGFDGRRGVALCWVRSLADVSAADRCRPLLYILDWWFEHQPWQLVHGAAVGLETGGGVLLAGRGGSGKSTTALACLRAGWRYAGDDYVLIRASPEPFVENLYCSARLRPDMVPRFAAFHDARSTADEIGEKAGFMLADRLVGAAGEGFRINAILLPRVLDRRHHGLEPATRAEAWMTLASTVMTLHGAKSVARAKIGAFVDATPAYRLALGSDLDALPQFLSRELGMGSP